MSSGERNANALIVIPCLNEEAHLPRLLDQFVAENPDALIVVADGGSSDRSRDIVAERSVTAPNLVLLDNPARIQAAGVNLAVARFGDARKWLVRVDAHCRYPPDYRARLEAAAAAHAADCVVVPMVTRGHSCFQVAVATAQNSVLGTGGSAHRRIGNGRFVDHGHHALIALERFASADGYRDDMVANEDAELDLRLTKGGARIWLEPALAIEYLPRSTPAALWRQYFRYGAGRARTLKLHRSRPKPRQVLPLLVPVAFGLLALTPVSGWFAVPVLVWLAIAIAAGVALGARDRRRCALLAGLAAAIMHLGWGLGFLRGLAQVERKG